MKDALHPSRRSLRWGIVMIALLCASAAFATNEGIFLIGNDALHMGRAGSGVASPRSAYWVMVNPASIVELDRRIDLSLYGVNSRIEIEPHGAFNLLQPKQLQSSLPYAAPVGGMIYPLKHGTLGLGVYIPYGSAIKYENASPIIGRVLQGYTGRTLDMIQGRGILAYGYEFDNGWALGASLHIGITHYARDHIVLRLFPPDRPFNWDNFFSAGFGLGVYKSWDKLSLGVSYVSKQYAQSVDDFNDLMLYPLDLPPVVQAGVAYRPRKNLELTLDYRWVNWKDVRMFRTVENRLGLQWDDQHSLLAGIEWRVGDKWTLMAGYGKGNSPIDEDHVFSSVFVPGTIEQRVSGGVSYAINEKHQLHLVFLHALENTLTESGKGGVFSKVSKGTKMSASGEYLILGYTMKF